MAEPTVKKFQITGGAAESYASMTGRGGGTRRRRTTGGIGGGGGATTRRRGEEQSTEIVRTGGTHSVQHQARAIVAPTRGGGGAGISAGWAAGIPKPPMEVLQAATGAKVPVPQPPPVTMPSTTGNTPLTQDKQTGGGQKVVLAPKKMKPAAKVLLAPKSSKEREKGRQPVHKTRKIRVGISGMRRRLTRAKKITEDSEKKGGDEIRRTLVDAKLIKDGSKVPESLMRAMYKDYLLLKDRAL